MCTFMYVFFLFVLRGIKVYKVVIPNSLVKNNCITDMEFLTYVYLYPYLKLEPWRDSARISAESLAYDITGETEPPRRIKAGISDALSSLIEKGIIKGKTIKAGQYIILKEDIPLDGFTILTSENIRKINKPALLRFYAMMVYACRNGTRAVPREYLQQLMECSDRTIGNYVAQLEDLGIIDTRRNNNATNVYSILTN